MTTIREHDADAHRSRLMALPAFFVLVYDARTQTYSGIAEGSFSIGPSPDRARLYLTSEMYDNFGGGPYRVDGRKDAERDLAAWEKANTNPDRTAAVYDARSDPDSLPVALDWEQWLRDHRPADTLSGVANKYGARNIAFGARLYAEELESADATGDRPDA